ncbi:MAG: HtaA domain-containing protein [Solirubrobacteraceae bacterium]|nr:HtaA domain-containing protein [Solirubrobacteraceae bacterium]
MTGRRLIPLVPLVLLGLAAPTGAAAVPLTGLTTVSLEGAAAKRLQASGVALTASAPGQLASNRLLLPVGSGSVAASTRVEHLGSLRLQRRSAGKQRSVTLSGLRLELSAKRRIVSAKFGGIRRTFLELDLRRGEYTAQAATSIVQISGARATLSSAAAKHLGAVLRIKGLRKGRLGVLTTTAGALPVQSSGSSTPPTSGAAPSTGAAGTPVPTPTTPGTPGATFPDPGTLARPASAVDVSASALTWSIRESFVRYISTEREPAASAGATPGPAKVVPPTSIPLVYDYAFQPAGGWYDAATATARLLFKGRIAFSYPSHGLDFDVIDPEVELRGSASRVVATFGGRQATAYAGRNVLVDLDLAAASPVITGNRRSYPAIAGAVPAAASGSIFAGFYAPGDPFGSIALDFTPVA